MELNFGNWVVYLGKFEELKTNINQAIALVNSPKASLVYWHEMKYV